VRTAHPHDTLLALLQLAARHGLRIRGLRLLEPGLEAVFLALTGKTLRDT